MKNSVLPSNIQIDSNSTPDFLLHISIGNKHLVKFQPIDEEMIRKSVIEKKDRSGPSGMGTGIWSRSLSSNQFETSITDPRETFAEVVKRFPTKLKETFKTN